MQELVNDNRLVYKYRFKTPTLVADKTFKGSRMLDLPAYYKDKNGKEYGFKEHKIHVDLTETIESNGNILSACSVYKDDDNEEIWHGLIQVAKGFSENSLPERKYILAHEWIHIMKGFRDKKTFKLVANRTDMIMALYASSGSADKFLKEMAEAYWKDDLKTAEILSVALGDLLVSKESVNEILEAKFNRTWEDFIKDLNETSDSLNKLFVPLVMVFSEVTGTGHELTYKKIRSMVAET